ncbi:hypothetical protein PR202_gb29624 [Eleusine coracana subsp. coracana]|uniref:Uncharacterized protein n=1 Tax=Eleusine coracana subsp. coracana TaxID=191504 RepID=A0AAV5FZW0_ELECO|nr:hypothetical protein QOZ80_3BG0252560 [Eleusine coracana subsp. coracana]GJN40416.1 hypothetical protein PR202_gb29624 [Eleusine coracana subsp. coracana]
MPMAVDSWLSKVRWGGKKSKSRSRSVGILAFEVGSLMSKLVHMWRAVGDAAMARLHQETVHLDGVRKVVSDDDEFLLGLACAELVDALRAASDSIAVLAARCTDPCLRLDEFRDAFMELADTGRDRHRWAAASWKEMDARARKMEKQVAATAALRRAMEELAEAEHGLRKLLLLSQTAANNGGAVSASKMSVASQQQQLVFSKKQEVKQLKQTSIWGCTFDTVVLSMARAAFTILARIKIVFNCSSFSSSSSGSSSGGEHRSLYRSLTLSSAVHPSSTIPLLHGGGGGGGAPSRKSISMDITTEHLFLFDHHQFSPQMKKKNGSSSFFLDSSLTPPPGTLGADALAPRYAAVVITIERMARSPRLVGPDDRDELYGMLTASVRAQLRARLRGAVAAADPGLAAQWRAALAGILEWLAPMAHATMRWQAERSFDKREGSTTTNNNVKVLLLQTLHFADRDKVEAAMAELLVGLNYVWRFDKEMACRALFAVHRQLMLNHANGTVMTSCALPPSEC